jgi:scyllo-inosamine-4-phosphate amidinotransferase 1
VRIHSYNEWSTLREIVVGSATHANWPSSDPVFAQESTKTTWTQSPVPSGPVSQTIIDEANEDLEGLCQILRDAGVTVYRPETINFQELGGMYNYCPRDRLLIAGGTVIDPAMMYPCRNLELEAYYDVILACDRYARMPRDRSMVMDAANVCRLGDVWLYLLSWSGNQAALDWLREQVPEVEIESCNFYSGVHIDSTIVPLREGVVMINSSRVQPDQVPKCLSSWTKIWVEDVTPQSFVDYPYASKWIAMNCLSIDPRTVIMDAAQADLRRSLERLGFTVIPHTLRHSRTLGGGFHCVTLDLWREDR